MYPKVAIDPSPIPFTYRTCHNLSNYSIVCDSFCSNIYGYVKLKMMLTLGPPLNMAQYPDHVRTAAINVAKSLSQPPILPGLKVGPLSPSELAIKVID